MPRHFIELNDFSKDELTHMLKLIRFLKVADQKGVIRRLLRGTSLAMIFVPITPERVLDALYRGNLC